MPIEKEKDVVGEFLEQCRKITFSPRQQFRWKYQIADDLNYLLDRATYFLETSADESDIQAAQVTLRIVARVAEFEGIRRAK